MNLEKENCTPRKHHHQQQPQPLSIPANGQQASSQNEGLIVGLKNFRKPGEKNFTQYSHLFVCKLPPDITEEVMRKLLEKYGQSFHSSGQRLHLYLLGNMNPCRYFQSGVGHHAIPWKAAAYAMHLSCHSASLMLQNLAQHVSYTQLKEDFSVFGHMEWIYSLWIIEEGSQKKALWSSLESQLLG